jgi:hypothetical protein
MSKPLFWTSIASAVVASVALAASGWVIANERGRTAEAPAPPPPLVLDSSPASHVSPNGDTVSPPSVPAVEAASKPAVTTPSPVKTAPALEPLDPSDLKVKRLIAATGVKNREPVGAADTFAAGDHPVYAFVELANRSARDADIVIVFERGSNRAGMVELAVPAQSGRWRTWGYSRALRESGTWDIVVREALSGKELARTPIEVTSQTASADSPAADPVQPEQPVGTI